MELKYEQENPELAAEPCTSGLSIFEHKEQVSEIDLSYHNDDSLIVVPPEERPPIVDIKKGKDLNFKENDVKSPEEYVNMFVQKGEKIKVDTIKRQKGDRVPQKKRYTLKERMAKLSEDVKRQMLIDALYEKLMKSQTSIVVTSETAKVLVLKKTDKNFLDESIKVSIDNKLLEDNFRDFDRPLENEETLWR